MEQVNNLVAINYGQLLITICTVLIGISAIKKILTEAIGWLGLETKYTRAAREQKELLQNTAQKVTELEKEYEDFKDQYQRSLDMVVQDTNEKFDKLAGKIDEMMEVLNSHNDKQNKMIVGIGNQIIVSRCQDILNRGYIYVDEYQDLNDHLFKPYTDLGGNSLAAHFMSKIKDLEVKER